MCVFPLHIGPDSWKIPDIAFLWVSFHNPPGNWPARATTCWINHFYFAFQNNVGLSVQQNNNYGTPPFANASNMDKICGFTEETPYFFNTKLVTSYHYVFKTSSLQTLKKKISRKSFSETIFQSFPFDNLNFCNSMQRCQDSPRCGEDFLFMKKVDGKHRETKQKTWGVTHWYCFTVFPVWSPWLLWWWWVIPEKGRLRLSGHVLPSDYFLLQDENNLWLSDGRRVRWGDGWGSLAV